MNWPSGRNFGTLLPVFSTKCIHFHWLFIGEIYSILINFIPNFSLAYYNKYKESYLGLYIFGIYTQGTYVYDLKGYRSKVTHNDMILHWHNIMHCNAMNKSIWNIKLVPLERASKTDLDTYLSLCDIFYFNTNYPPISLQWVDIIEFDCWRK